MAGYCRPEKQAADGCWHTTKRSTHLLMAVRENRKAGQSMNGRQKRKCGVWPKAKTGTMGAPASMASLWGRRYGCEVPSLKVLMRQQCWVGSWRPMTCPQRQSCRTLCPT